MTDAAVLSAIYTEWKMVKTRSALVLCFEVPLEQQALVQAVLGTPLQGESIHVAIARLKEEPKPLPAAKKGTLAQQAGILCNEPAFQHFAEMRGYFATSDGAADFVRHECAVASRADLDRDTDAGRKFRNLKADFDIWMRDAA